MPDVLTATADTTYAHVLLRAEYTSATATTATVERSIDGGVTWTLVRGGDPLTLVGPDPGPGPRIGYLYDSEAPLDVSLNYRATSNESVVITAGPVTIDSLGFGWLKDPARPWANLKINECVDTVSAGCELLPSGTQIMLVGGGLGTETYAADYTLFPILNRARPVDVHAFRKDAKTSLRLLSGTLLAATDLNVFWAWGGPILLQLPPVYGWADRYYQPDQVEESRLTSDLSRPYRLWDVPLTVIDPPVGPAQGTFEANWCILADIYTTYADLTATGLTWGDVMEGDAVPPSLTDGYGFGPYGTGPYGDGG